VLAPAGSTTINAYPSTVACLFCGGALTERDSVCPHCGCTRPVSLSQAAPLTGRSSELAELKRHVDGLMEGHGRLIGVAGPAGIGKSRLVEAALAYIKEQRCFDFVIRGFEPNVDLPYWTLIEALHGELENAAPGVIPSTAASAGIPDLIRALQVARETPQGATTGFESRDAAVNARIYEANSAVIRTMTGTRPLVVIAEDLQWFDTPTLNLMRYTVRLAKTLPILLICTYRADGEGETRWRPLLEDAAREGRFTELRLGGLDQPAARRLALAAAPAPLSDRAVDEVLRLAEGNPFYVGQLARSYALASPGGSRTPLPAALRGFVDQHLAGLSPACHALVQAVAVLGRECPLDLLARISGSGNGAGGADLRDLASALDEALTAHVLTERESGGRPRFDFSHALLREAAARELNALLRAGLHLRIADALHERRAAGGREPAAEIAEHYLEAGPLAPVARTLDYVRAAADEAESMGSSELSARFLAASVELLVAQPPEPPRSGRVPEPRRATHGTSVPEWAAGDPGWGLDDGASPSGAPEHVRESSAAHPDSRRPRHGDEIARVRMRLMEAYGAAGEIDAAEREAELALAHWRETGEAREEAEVHAALAEQLNPRLRPRDVVSHADTGLALLGAARTPLAARLRFLRAHARYMLDDTADLLPTAEWLEAGEFFPVEPAAALWSRMLRVLWHIFHVADAKVTVDLCREAVEHTRRMGDRRAEAMARLWEAEVLNRDARPREAISALDEARRLARETGSAPMIVDAGALRAEALLQLGRWEELEQVVDETLPVLIRLRSTYFGYSLIAAHSWSRKLRGLGWSAPDGLEVRFRESLLFVAAYRSNFAREQVEFAAAVHPADRGTGRGPAAATPGTGTSREVHTQGAPARSAATPGEDERTARLLDWLVANVPRSGPGISWATAGLPLLGTLTIAGRRDDVAARYEEARRFPRFLQSVTFGPLELARAATLLKRWDAAESHFDDAVRLATSEGLRIALARILVERGAMYRARGRRGDRPRAAEVLKRAVALCAELGLGPDQARARDLLVGLDTATHAPMPAGLTPREVEVLRLVAAGRTNREIASTLTISEKTVEQHLLNLYQKLQVDSRAKAVAFAYANGLVE
jgi:DNA-binding CsgD family transcriptional regulator